MSCQLVDKSSATHLISRENRVFVQTEDSIGEDDVVGEKTTAHRLEKEREKVTLFTVHQHKYPVKSSIFVKRWL